MKPICLFYSQIVSGPADSHAGRSTAQETRNPESNDEGGPQGVGEKGHVRSAVTEHRAQGQYVPPESIRLAGRSRGRLAFLHSRRETSC